MTFDDDLCEGEMLTDDDIISEVKGQPVSSSFDDESNSRVDELVDEETFSTPSHNQLANAFKTIYAGLLATEKLPGDSFCKFFELKKHVLGDE